jgi:hypothetical protein
MTRQERRALQRQMVKQAAAWPEHLVPVPESQWPARLGRIYPVAVWRSRQYLVQQHEERPLNGIEVRRLSVNRVTLNGAGQWGDAIPWDDLWRIKQETGHGDWYGVEVYPRERDLVIDCNLRHLWLVAEPLAIGWFQ